METHTNNLFGKTSFCTCSYLSELNNRRASLVRGAIQTWDKLLELPFAEKIFLDDGSPDVNGIRLLKQSNYLNKFDDVRYNSLVHPPHSNFGILSSMTVCQGDYIFHLDDDIRVTASYEDCLKFLEQSIDILDKDEKILGINLLTMPKEFQKEWFPANDYPGSNVFAHPNKYFGTAACLIKRTLLERVSLTDIINWGEQQPHTWEVLVSDDASSFLVSKEKTPFGLDLDAWVYHSVTNKSLRGIKKRLKYNLGKNFPFLKKLIYKTQES